MCSPLGYQNTLELRSRASEVTGPADQLDDGILVYRHTISADRHEIAIAVRTQEDVVGVQKVHARCRCTGPRRVDGIAAGVDTTVKNHVSRLPAAVELERGKTSARVTRSIRHDALDGLH